MNLHTDVNSSLLISFQKNKGSLSPVLQSEMRKASCFPSSVGHQLWAESNATYLRPKLQNSSSSGNSAEEAWGSHKASECPAHVLNYLQLGPGSLSWHMNKQGSGSLWHKNTLESRKLACNNELCIQECCGPPKGEHYFVCAFLVFRRFFFPLSWMDRISKPLPLFTSSPLESV